MLERATGLLPFLKSHFRSQVLRAPNIGGHRKLFCRKAMLPFGSHQVSLYRVSRQNRLKGLSSICRTNGSNAKSMVPTWAESPERPQFG